MFLLHSHASEGFLSEVVLHALEEALKLLPLLFITYLLMEYIEHRAKGRAEAFISRTGKVTPLFGGLLGAVPQCGFSAAASELYAGGIISAGTLIAVFLSTSDEMLPIMISGNFSFTSIAAILGYKVAAAIIAGFAIDLILRLRGISHACHHESHEECEESCHCHHGEDCHGGILPSAVRHTAKIFAFIILINLLINTAVFFLGEEGIFHLIPSVPVLSHLVSAVFGLIPNCAISVALTSLGAGGIISVGEMLAGLFSGAGVGLAVLLRRNSSRRENLSIIVALVLLGTLFGALADLIMPNILV